jgi:PIF1-like helicase
MVLFGGHFKQILPVVLGGYRSQTVWKCLKMSPLWNRIISLQLTTNVQLQSHPSCQDFLLSNGEGATGNYVEIPNIMVATENTIEGLIHDIFGNEQHFDIKVILTLKMMMLR